MYSMYIIPYTHTHNHTYTYILYMHTYTISRRFRCTTLRRSHCLRGFGWTVANMHKKQGQRHRVPFQNFHPASTPPKSIVAFGVISRIHTATCPRWKRFQAACQVHCRVRFCPGIDFWFGFSSTSTGRLDSRSRKKGDKGWQRMRKDEKGIERPERREQSKS